MTPHISENARARKLKFYSPLDRAKCLCRYKFFSARGYAGDSTPSDNWGPHISETIRVRTGLSNLSAMAGRIDIILGVAGQFSISAPQRYSFASVVCFGWHIRLSVRLSACLSCQNYRECRRMQSSPGS